MECCSVQLFKDKYEFYHRQDTGKNFFCISLYVTDLFCVRSSTSLSYQPSAAKNSFSTDIMCEVPPLLKVMFSDLEALFSQRDHSYYFVVLYDAIWPSYCTSSNGKTDDEWDIIKDLQESSHGLTKVQYYNLSGETEKNPENPVRWAGVTSKAQPWHLLNTTQEYDFSVFRSCTFLRFLFLSDTAQCL